MRNDFILEKAYAVAEAGIPYTLNNIIGVPYDTRELLFDTISLNRQIGTFDSLSVNIFIPYHGTPLREWAIKEDWLNPNRQTTSVISEAIWEMPDPYLSAPEILAMQRVFPLYVSMDRSKYPDIKRAETFGEKGNALFETLSEEFYRTKYGESEADRKLTFSG
jgi:anaerobic magnesium-protoporphyrin IX monomethyl ester cyclase